MYYLSDWAGRGLRDRTAHAPKTAGGAHKECAPCLILDRCTAYVLCADLPPGCAQQPLNAIPGRERHHLDIVNGALVGRRAGVGKGGREAGVCCRSLHIPHARLTAVLSLQVLAQALSEEDLVPPSELASLHTYDLARHLSMVRGRGRGRFGLWASGRSRGQ